MFRHSLPEQCHSPVWPTAHALLPHGATDTSLGSLEESAPVGTGETVSRAPWYSLSSPVPWWPLLLTPAHPFPSRAPVSRKAGSPGKLSCRRARYSISQWDSKAGKNGRGKNKQLKKPKPNKPQTNIILPHQKKKKKKSSLGEGWCICSKNCQVRTVLTKDYQDMPSNVNGMQRSAGVRKFIFEDIPSRCTPTPLLFCCGKLLPSFSSSTFWSHSSCPHPALQLTTGAWLFLLGNPWPGTWLWIYTWGPKP